MNPRARPFVSAVLLALLLAPLVALVGGASSPLADRVPAPVTAASVDGVHPLDASLSFALTASATQADPKDIVVFTVYFNNTGTQAAPDAWINVSAPAGFTFLDDTASGNVSGYPDYGFSSVALGLHSFQIGLVVDVGVAPGSRLAVSATLVYSDGTGAQRFLGPAGASVLVGVVTTPLYLGWGSATARILTPAAPTGPLASQGTFALLSGGPAVAFDLMPPLARPFRALNATAILYLQPLAPPASVDVNVTLVDVNGAATNAVASVERTFGVTGSGYWTLFYPFPAIDYTFAAGHAIRLQVLNALATGQTVFLATNATAEPSRLSLQTTTYVTVDSLEPVLSPTTYLSPESYFVAAANVSDPFGSADILAVHLNVTGPSGPLVTWADAVPTIAVDPSSPSAWRLFEYTIPAPLANGTYAVEATAVGRSGTTDVAAGGAVVRAPRFTLQKTARPPQANSWTRVTYSIWYNNTGSGPAGTVWLNDTLPSQMIFLWSVPAPTATAGNSYSWVFTSVSLGSHQVQITARVGSGVTGIAYIRNWASLNYTDPQGFRWPALQSHADVVINGPFLTLAQSSAPAGLLHANERVVFAINLTNTGDAASTVWVNDTLPAGLSYVTDTAGSVGGTRTVVGSSVRWVFANLASGTPDPVYLNFTMTAQAAAGLAGGLPLPNAVAVNDTSTNGLLMPEQLSLLPLAVASPSLEGSVVSFGIPTAVPDVGLPLFVNFTNEGNEPAGVTWSNLTLSPSLRFVSAVVPAAFANSVLRLTLPNASLGANSIRIVVAATSAVRDRDVLSVSGTLTSSDGYGNVLATLALAAGTVSVALPEVAFRLTPANVSAEAGTTIAYTVTGGNSGSGIASAVWLNLTIPAGLVYVNDSLGANRSALGRDVSWSWRDVAPGSGGHALVLGVDRAAVDGSLVAFSVSVQAFDRGGGPRPVSTFGGNVRVRAPAFALSVWADQNRTVPGSTLTYTLVARNAGSTTAQSLWLTDPIDSHLSVVYYVAAVRAAGTAVLNWTYQDVAPGQSIVITLVVNVADGTPGNTPIPNILIAEYTNSAGTVLAYVQSAPSAVTVSPNLLGLLLILAGGSGIGALVVFVVYRRYRVQIEDVFLIYRDGILVSHLTQGEGLEKDEDQLSGMLTAVQDFVRDAFTYGEHRELHQLEFGDYHILIERGKLVYLAVVYQGRDSGLIRKKVRSVLDRVESSYGGVFERWDGDMSKVDGTWDLLREGFVEAKRPWSLMKSKPA